MKVLLVCHLPGVAFKLRIIGYTVNKHREILLIQLHEKKFIYDEFL